MFIFNGESELAGKHHTTSSTIKQCHFKNNEIVTHSEIESSMLIEFHSIQNWVWKIFIFSKLLIELIINVHKCYT